MNDVRMNDDGGKALRLMLTELAAALSVNQPTEPFKCCWDLIRRISDHAAKTGEPAPFRVTITDYGLDRIGRHRRWAELEILAPDGDWLAKYEAFDPWVFDDWNLYQGDALLCAARVACARWLATVPFSLGGSDGSQVNQVTDNDERKDERTGALPARRHSDGFRSVHWYGTDYKFTQLQAACVSVLWEHFDKGTPVVPQDEVMESAGSNSDRPRLRDVFKNHPAWGTMIVPAGKGLYQMQVPEDQ